MYVFVYLRPLSLLVQDSHGVDFSRVRTMNLESNAATCRQTMVFAKYDCAELNALMHRQCSNRAGCVRIRPSKYTGTIGQVVPQIKQLFRRFSCDSPATMHDARFEFFKEYVLPGLLKSARSASTAHETGSGTLLFVPSYLDFVRLRDLFRQHDASVAACSEYVRTPDLSRFRTQFYGGRIRLMLYTERLHFYHRLRIRGARHMIFYGLPQNANFYPELLNIVEVGGGGSAAAGTATALFSKYDALELERVVGTRRAKNMLKGSKRNHLFC